MSSTTESRSPDTHEIHVDTMRNPIRVSGEAVAAIGKVCEGCNGACCRDFSLALPFSLPIYDPDPGSGFWRVDTKALAKRDDDMFPEVGEVARFLAEHVEMEVTPGRSPGRVRCTCRLLGSDGRCTAYDSRPSICRKHVCLSAWTAGQPPPHGWRGGSLPPAPEEWKTHIRNMRE